MVQNEYRGTVCECDPGASRLPSWRPTTCVQYFDVGDLGQSLGGLAAETVKIISFRFSWMSKYSTVYPQRRSDRGSFGRSFAGLSPGIAVPWSSS